MRASIACSRREDLTHAQQALRQLRFDQPGRSWQLGYPGLGTPPGSVGGACRSPTDSPARTAGGALWQGPATAAGQGLAPPVPAPPQLLLNLAERSTLCPLPRTDRLRHDRARILSLPMAIPPGPELGSYHGGRQPQGESGFDQHLVCESLSLGSWQRVKGFGQKAHDTLENPMLLAIAGRVRGGVCSLCCPAAAPPNGHRLDGARGHPADSGAVQLPSASGWHWRAGRRR